MSHEVARRMAYIQSLFLRVQQQGIREGSNFHPLAWVPQEPPLFRSILVESASACLAYQDLSQTGIQNSWAEFAEQVQNRHFFHLDIGLGWGFAKARKKPEISPDWPHHPIKWMMWDGFGYYQALYHQRATLREQSVPSICPPTYQRYFDQGVGRRLWYMSRGIPMDLIAYLNAFPLARQADLWRGVGIAAGYVGGMDANMASQLDVLAAKHLSDFHDGLFLAGVARTLDGTIEEKRPFDCLIHIGMHPTDLTHQMKRMPCDWVQNRSSLTIAHLKNIFTNSLPSHS